MVEKLELWSRDTLIEYTPVLTRVHDTKWKALTVYDLFKGHYQYPVYADNNLKSYLIELNFTWETQMLASVLLKDWIHVCDIFKKRIGESYKYFSKVHCIDDFPDRFSESQIYSHIFLFYLLFSGWEVDHIPNIWRNSFVHEWQYYLYDLECFIPIGVIDGDSGNDMSVEEIFKEQMEYYMDFFDTNPSARFSKRELTLKVEKFLEYWMEDITFSEKRFYVYAQSVWIPDEYILDIWNRFLESILSLEERVKRFIQDFATYWV